LVFLLVLGLRPHLPTHRAFAIALTLSYAIELSQLYQAAWINGIRDTRLGGLLLGHGFLWSDLLCYTVGITFGALVVAHLMGSCYKHR
jgi:glycopeptide antibiotics resistance protein